VDDQLRPGVRQGTGLSVQPSPDIGRPARLAGRGL